MSELHAYISWFIRTALRLLCPAGTPAHFFANEHFFWMMYNSQKRHFALFIMAGVIIQACSAYVCLSVNLQVSQNLSV